VKLKYLPTIILVKTTHFLVRLFGKGEGTALPGLIVEKLAPDLLGYFAAQIPNVILITGTNGKTTTQNAVTSILRHSGKKVLSNKSGSNMKRGLLSLFINKCTLWGSLKYDYAVLEIEEATMPKVTAELKPKQIVITNLYRDQLDAYGEIERTRTMFRRGLELAPQAVVVLNNDDPQLRGLAKDLANKVVTVAIDPEYLLEFKYEGTQPESRKRPDLLAEKIVINEELGTEFKVGIRKFAFASPGIFNVYNALAAIACCQVAGISDQDIEKGLLLMPVTFGRGEVITRRGITYRLLLAKNPAGLNLVFDLLTNTSKPNLILILNDKIADGRDVSWIWDAKFEKLADIKPDPVILSGTRAEELLLRLKYAFGNMSKIDDRHYIINNKLDVYIESDIKAMLLMIEQNELGDYFYVVHTYTGMLAFRKLLAGKSLDE
jgi:lipid II isoglutaminyl synthase (glutamine-hydrolysing)